MTTAARRLAPARLPALLLAATVLSACQSGPPAPDWQLKAAGHLERFTQAQLRGDARVAAREFTLARQETARTGRPEQVARVELTRCALQVASLDFAPCAGFAPLQADAGDAERAYANYLEGRAHAAQAALLPPWHRALAASAAPGTTALQAVDEPLARLVAAGVLLRQGRLPPDAAALAADTAAHQGWRRPLLAWLGVQARLADERGQTEEAARLRRRMALVAPGLDAPASAPAPGSAP